MAIGVSALIEPAEFRALVECSRFRALVERCESQVLRVSSVASFERWTGIINHTRWLITPAIEPRNRDALFSRSDNVPDHRAAAKDSPLRKN